ncbi:uncharacterized protein LOC103568231 [Microplitis demolitor]|uniref:uncharacterized protein LOC103568231 n=1 Tax=Microplitis demolitor TaxID=69319 RepID=UPI0004CD32F1|nr:uncharacterized protein LOC103568231 [Microplitis demolitor]
MARDIKFIAALVLFLVINESIQESISGLFPSEKTLVYNYYGDVKAGIIEPAAYASQYSLSGKLHIKQDTSDPKYQFAYYIILKDVKTGLHNGNAAHYEPTKILSPISEAAKAIEDPFLLIYNEFGQLKGVKIPDQEPVWSKNMKMAMASMLQLDLKNMKIDAPIKPHSFMIPEKSIHGDCWTSYDVQAKYPAADQQDNQIVVTKFSSPKNCTNYNVQVFDHVDAERCDVPRRVPINMAARRLFEIKYKNNSILIEKLIAHGGVNYFPLQGRSEAHYVLNNASFLLDKIVASSEIPLPAVDFNNVSLITDLSYQRSQSNYAENAAVDVTNGRNVVKQDVLINKIVKMLNEAADYLEEDHVEAIEPDSVDSQTINRILDIMSYMEVSSFEKVFAEIQNTTDERNDVIKSLFLGIVPQVGTTASSIFIWNIIKSKRITEITAKELLAKMPFNIRVPSEEFLIEMEPLIYSRDSLALEVHKASVLCFSTMVYRTFKNLPATANNKTLNKYLNHFYDKLINTKSYGSQLNYLMAISNVQVGKIYKLLTPIIRGDIEVSNNPVGIRLMAIWAIKKSISNNYNAAHDLLWPIMSDYNLPLKLRIAAYDILIRQAPTMTNILHIYWFMVYEKNEHLYNYHHTTIKGLANSIDLCDVKLRELTTKIMRFTKIHTPVPYQLSESYMFDSMDEIYGHGESLRVSVTRDELTGNLEVIYFEHSIVEERKKVNDWAVYLHLQNVDDLMYELRPTFLQKFFSVKDKNVLDVLEKVTKNISSKEDSHIDTIIINKGHVVSALHLDAYSIQNFDSIMPLINIFINNINIQQVVYDNIYEQQVISEMGLPVILETKTPTVYSLKLNYDSEAEELLSIKIDSKIWHHQDYSMSIYNPLSNIWHSIRRSSVLNAALTIQFNVDLDLQSPSLKFKFPLLSAEKLSAVGIMTHTKDVTVVTDNEDNILETACPNCTSQVVVSKGDDLKKNYQNIYDSKDTGLRLTTGIFDCENEITPTLIKKEWIRSLIEERKNSWNSLLLHSILGIRQQFKNIILSPQMGSCGGIVKIKPSIIYPTSHVDLALKVNFNDIDRRTPSLLNENKLDVHGTLDVIADSTNSSKQSWDLKMNINTSRGHLKNGLKVQLKRVIPGEKNLKICIDGQKIYPAIPDDPLKVGRTVEETNGKLTFSMDHADDDLCHRNETLITITVKGELTDEQKKLFTKESINGACYKDMNNPLYKISSILLPKTVNCLNEAIRHTTLRKYTLHVAHKQVPRNIISKIFEFEDVIKSIALPNIKYTNNNYTEPGSAKIIIQFPMDYQSVNMSVITPFRSYDLIDVDLNVESNPPRLNGFGPDYEKHLWFPLDNTRFNVEFLGLYSLDMIKICSLYPKVVLTLDGGEIPYSIPTEWTLVSGDYIYKNFAIFVKNINDKLALKIYATREVVEITPNDNGNIQIQINNEILNSNQNGSYVPVDATSSWMLKITKHGEHVIIAMQNEIVIVYTENTVSLMIGYSLQGKISGLCGYMDGTYKNKIPNVYLLA